MPITSPREKSITRDSSKFQSLNVSTFSSPPGTRGQSQASSIGMEIPDFMVWVKEEPFIFGQVCPTPCTKIGVNVLRKIAEYCRDKDGYYPEINLLQWGHIGRYKLQLSTDLSWLYLRVFDIISKRFEDQGNSSQTGSGSDDESLPKESWDARCEEIRLCAVDSFDELKVDTLQFLVFLYIQHFYRLHKKYFSRPLTSSDEPWPCHSTPGSTPRPSHTAPHSPNSTLNQKKKSIPEQIHTEFITENLEDLVDYLKLVIKLLPFEDDRIPIEIPKALSFILGAASIFPHDTEFKSLDESFFLIPEVAEAVEFDMKTESLNKNKFIQWIKSNLKLNPWGPSSTPVPQNRVECLAGVWDKTKAYEMNRIYWNTQLCPKSWYLISSVDNQVLHLDNVKPFSSLKIHRCNNSYLYIPGAFSSISVEKCRNSTIFLGPAGKVVKISECANITVTAVGRIFILCDNYKSNFHLLTPCQPVVCGSKNRRISLGPYNSFYPKLLQDMKLVELGVQVQKWNKPIELGSNGIPLPKDQISNCCLIRIERFNNLRFPFEMEGSTTKNPVDLPQNYAMKVMQLENKADELKKEIDSKDLSTEQEAQLNTIITARFQKWLKEQGHFKQLKGLRSMQHSIRVGTSVPILDSKAQRRRSESNTTTNVGILGVASDSGGLRSNGDTNEDKTPKLSSASWISGLSSSTSFVGSLSDVEDYNNENEEVFNFLVDDFDKLDSVFYSDGEDTDEFDNDGDTWNKPGCVSGSYSRNSCTGGNDSDVDLLQALPMDDGLHWKPI